MITTYYAGGSIVIDATPADEARERARGHRYWALYWDEYADLLPYMSLSDAAITAKRYATARMDNFDLRVDDLPAPIPGPVTVKHAEQPCKAAP